MNALLILVSFLAMAEPGIQDPCGFRGHPWGCDIAGIAASESTLTCRDPDEVNEVVYLACTGEDGELVVFAFEKKENGLSMYMGTLRIPAGSDLGVTAVEGLRTKYGKPDTVTDSGTGVATALWTFKTTSVMLILEVDKTSVSYTSETYLQEKIRKARKQKDVQKDKLKL